MREGDETTTTFVPSIVGSKDPNASSSAGGHFAAETIARKVLQAGLWWPTLFSDAMEFVKRCDSCQRATKPQNWERMPLSMNLATQPFEKWGINTQLPYHKKME